jgi:VIT1/CCC1 family predicted Fe2+/Mn2+ transporter
MQRVLLNNRPHNFDYTAQIISGSISGILSAISVISGVVGADLTPKTVLILGIASSFTNSLNNTTAAYIAEDKPHIKGVTGVFVSSLIMGLIPLSIYIFELITGIYVSNKYVHSILLAIGLLLWTAYYKAEHFKKPLSKVFLNVIFIGGMAALVSYAIGYWLKQVNIR